ncbi:MAG: hypothetical protein JWP25_1757 [Bradyrhizobium sp.]|jgi:hypothetical protein|nr:hypothetical protein [Bradyrhizobium sp.]
MTSHPKRPKDPNQLAKSIIDIATAQAAESPESGFTKRARREEPREIRQGQRF